MTKLVDNYHFLFWKLLFCSTSTLKFVSLYNWVTTVSWHEECGAGGSLLSFMEKHWTHSEASSPEWVCVWGGKWGNLSGHGSHDKGEIGRWLRAYSYSHRSNPNASTMGSVALNKLLNFSVFPFPHLWIETASTTKESCENSMT